MIGRVRSALCRLSRDQRGQSTVEYALGLAVFLYLIMGVVDLGRAFYAYNVVANTAREGARYAAVPTRTVTEIINYATARAYLGSLTLTVVDRGTAGDSNDPAVVQASHSFSPITPLVARVCCGGGSMTISARSSMRVEN